MKFSIKYNLHKDSSPIWVTVDGDEAARKKIKELVDQGYNPSIDRSKSQMTWLDIKALGFDLYLDNSEQEEQFILIANGSPVLQETRTALIEGGFSETRLGYTGKMGLRTSPVLKALPGAKRIEVFPNEIDYQTVLSQHAGSNKESDPMLGRTWISSFGECKVINSCKSNTETLYCVETQGKKSYDWYLARDLEQVIALDQNPATKWRKWEVLNPHDQINLPKGYDLSHIFIRSNHKIIRVAGKPVSLKGYETFDFFMAKYDGRWNVFEKTTGLSVTNTNGLKTQKEALSIAADCLFKHAGSEEKLSKHLSGQLIIPQPGQIPLPPAKEPNFTLPELQTYGDAQKWIKTKAHKYGSKKKLYESPEYKAVSPTIERLSAQKKEDLILAARQSVAEAGLSSGDEVFCLSNDKTSGMYGTLYYANTGMPRIRVHSEQSVLGGYTPSNKRVDWHDGWARAEAQAENIISEVPSHATEEPVGLAPS